MEVCHQIKGLCVRNKAVGSHVEWGTPSVADWQTNAVGSLSVWPEGVYGIRFVVVG